MDLSVTWMVPVGIFCVDQESKMATATAVFDIGTYGKIDKSYFLESTNMIQSKLYMSSLSLDGVLRT